MYCTSRVLGIPESFPKGGVLKLVINRCLRISGSQGRMGKKISSAQFEQVRVHFDACTRYASTCTILTCASTVAQNPITYLGLEGGLCPDCLAWGRKRGPISIFSFPFPILRFSTSFFFCFCFCFSFSFFFLAELTNKRIPLELTNNASQSVANYFPGSLETAPNIGGESHRGEGVMESSSHE